VQPNLPASGIWSGSWRKAPAWRSSQGPPKVYNEPPKKPSQRNQRKTNQPKSLETGDKSPGTKTCNGRAAVSRAAKEPSTSRETMPKTIKPCINKTKQARMSARAALERALSGTVQT
jgi:hypothetical protein